MKTLILVTILFLAIFSTQAVKWAVLVAGSNGYVNYRHQADICHAYQIVKGNGILEENIIVMAYDDIAYNPSNPFQGQIFNKPSYGAGVNVYDDCKIDYSGNDVNSTNFLNVLKGNSTAVQGRKVLQSTGDDHVFINFVGHGADGILGFPNDYLYADDLIDVLNYMNQSDSYNQLVFYLEACESGSMFEKLPNNTNIFATTASDSYFPSYAVYCPAGPPYWDAEDYINGVDIGTCLGDAYSVNWMENSDSGVMKVETLLNQFKLVKSETLLSMVSKFGDNVFQNEVIGEFQGDSETSFFRNLFKPHDISSPKKIISVNSRDVKLAYLQK